MVSAVSIREAIKTEDIKFLSRFVKKKIDFLVIIAK